MTSSKNRTVAGQERSCLRISYCDISDPPKTPPGTPMRPPVCLVYSGDLFQDHRLQEIFKSNFDGKSNVPPAVLKPVKEGT